MNRSLERILLSALAATGITLALILNSPLDPAQSAPPPPEPTPVPRPLPPNQPARGLMYDGLEYGDANACPEMLRTRERSLCTHGPDPAPSGVDPRISVAPLSLYAPASVSAIQCDGDGTAGYRTQVMYVHGTDTVDRYNQYAASIQTWAAGADVIYRDSAGETGGYRRLRFVHDSNCSIIVLDVTISATGSIDFNTMVNRLSALGYNRSDRKYMIFMDVNLYCGIGSLWGSTTSAQSNSNNSGPSYARADSGCWTDQVIAHESMHNMGAVQHNAPHSTYLQNQSSSNTWHCSDEYDRMCYSDAAGVVMDFSACSSSAHDRLFDCHHDDYYSTNPAPGSYLATFWNTANNRFLISAPPLLTPRIFLPLVIK